MHPSRSRNRVDVRLLTAGGLIVGFAALLIGRQLFGAAPPPDNAQPVVSAAVPPKPSIDTARTAVAVTRAERRQARREERERREQARLAAAAIPMSAKLAELRARDGEPAAARPDLEMIKENRGAPLNQEQRRIVANRMIEAGRRAMAAGDLGLVYEHFFRAAETYSSVETHAVLGELLLKTRVISSADYHLRWAAEHDSDNPDRWIALANAYALKPDPGAAYKAVAKARELDPAIDIVRDEAGLFRRQE